MDNSLLDIKGLSVEYCSNGKVVRALDSIDLTVNKGEVLGIVGESGCGKSTLAMSILDLISPPGYIVNGSIVYENKINILNLNDEDINRFRWKEIAMVFQAAQNTLNPVSRIDEQLNDILEAHPGVVNGNIRERIVELFKLVKLDPERVLKAYPHQLSGGMRQRVAIVMALILNPPLVILDEPTTALDVLTQKQILDILKDLHKGEGITMLFITHDLSIVAEITERIAIMYAGKIVELASIHEIFYNSKHPYTRGLLRAAPSIIGDLETLISIPGSPPDLSVPLRGCRFSERCSFSTDICRETEPALIEVATDHLVACHRWGEIDGK